MIIIVCIRVISPFAAEVVEVVGSPCLKESLEAHLSDVLHGMPDNPGEKGDTNAQNNKNGTGSNEGMVVSNPMKSVSISDDLCGLVAGKHRVPSCLPTADVPMVQHESQQDSQDSILDIEGVSDDEDEDVEVTLKEWKTEGMDASDTDTPESEIPFAAENPTHHKDDRVLMMDQNHSDSWRSFIHRDDPFLSLIPSEIPRVAFTLQEHHLDHAEAYKRLGFRVSGGFYYYRIIN